MFFSPILASLLAASSVLAVPAVRRSGAAAEFSPADFKGKNFEGYYKFKQRYRALDCASQKGSTFYTECCSPLGADESLNARPDYCTPSTCTSTASSTSAVTPISSTANLVVATRTSSSVTVVASTSSSVVPTSTSVGEDDNDDDYEWVCDDEEEEQDKGDETEEEEDEENLPWCDELEDDSEYEHVQPTSTTSSSSTSATPTTSSTLAPTTNTTPAPATTSSSSAPAPVTTSQSPQPGNDVQKGGFATFYYQNGNAGACGEKHGDDELIGAIDHERYGDNFGVVSGECGRRVRITNPKNGKSVDITIKDVCPTCTNHNSIDLSYKAFTSIAAESEGYIPIEWSYL